MAAFSGALYVFRAKRADRIKIVWWDGSGVCLYAKRLEKSSFCWPRIGHVRVQLNHAHLLALLPVQAAGSSIHAATTMKMLGSTSIWTN
ncbi:IS66 Orf2 like protein [Paracoccus haematequi]|uniref:IS66 Orf2 like protein n=1 Tax=Paracoccus haematequi TaxID=2491866 RepID=A0A3S4CMA6_9RHOB|nr:IS66 family insertion sequence element accessory protein TnpB [Paracoccus haematequi]VDS10794.1 IS66 Orf2 like protein [Paracoccus haematequi]